MELRELVKVVRFRWVTVCVTILLVVLGAVVINSVTTPLYQASTRLFVSAATSGASASDLYQGNRLSQDRVLSYTQLLMGDTLAQRTIDKLRLDMSASALRAQVRASAKAETVLIDVGVIDESPARARDIANALSDEFVVMVRELETPEVGARPDARVVVEQRASLPVNPVSPKKTRNILVAVALGVLLGIGIALLRDHLDNTVKDRQSIDEITGVGLVGSIPFDKERKREPPIAFGNNNTAIAEAFRKLRTNLQFLSVDNPPRVIVVTSSFSGEGKSTTAINIALALAEADHSVALVDGDMRRPALAEYLDLVGSVGLSTVLSGRSSLAEALQKTRYPGVTVLTAGAIPPNPSELLGSLAAQRALGDLRSQFDYVIVDSSPLLAVTDAAILAAEADGVLLIARYGQTKRDKLTHSVKILQGVGASLIGTVLTLVPTRGKDAYSYSYYRDSSARRSTSASSIDGASTVAVE